jgi:hypothetical protein
MSKLFRTFATAVCTALAFASASCAIAPAKLAMPEGFVADGAGYAVDGHSVRYAGKPVVFGPYRTVEVQGSGLPTTWTLTGPLFGLGVGKESRRYAFSFVAPGRSQVEVRCLSAEWFISFRRDRVSAQIPTSLEKPALGCDIDRAVGAENAAVALSPLRLWARGNDLFGTYAGSGYRDYRIDSSRRLEGVGFDMGEATGYIIRRDERVVAVIDVVSDGRVYFAAGLDEGERADLAAAVAALLMLG